MSMCSNGSDVPQKALVFLVRAEPHHALDAGPVIPTAVEQNQFLRRRQMLAWRWKYQERVVLVGRLGERDDAGLARAQMLDDALDRPSFPPASRPSKMTSTLWPCLMTCR